MQNKGFGIVYQNIMRNKFITPESKAIYGYLASFAGSGVTCYPSTDLMISELNMSRERFYKHMKLLVDLGIVKKQQEKNGTKFAKNIYTINSFPSFPHAEFTTTENETTELSITEDANTKNNSIKNNSIKSNSIEGGVNSEASMNNTKVKKDKEEGKVVKKEKYGEYKNVRITELEKERLINEVGQEMFNKCIKKLDEYIQETGKKYKDHNLTIRRWVIDAVKNDLNKKKGEEGAYGEHYSTGNCTSVDYYEQFR